MPKKAKAKEPKRFLPLPAGVTIGDLVRYYFNGWRTGYLEEVSGNDAGIRSCGTYKHGPERLKWVNIGDLQAIEKEKQT